MADESGRGKNNLSNLKPLPKPARPPDNTKKTAAKQIEAAKKTQAVYLPQRTKSKPGAYKKKKPSFFGKFIKNPKTTGMAALGVVFIVLAVLIIWSTTNKNAFDLYVNGNLIAHFARSNDVTRESIAAQIITHLEDSIGANIYTEDIIEIETANRGKKLLVSYEEALSAAARALTYKIAASMLTIHGTDEIILRNRSDVQAVLDYLAMPFKEDGANYVSISFDENEVTEKIVFVDSETPVSVNDALLKLDIKVRSFDNYEIVSGDTLGAIALRFNTTVNKICIDNPGYDTSTILQPGKVLLIDSVKPFVSIITVEETVRTEIIPRDLREEENPYEYQTYYEIVNEGRDGEQEVTVRIVRVNGIQRQPEETINTEIIIQPIDRVVIVGTSEIMPQRR
ncbi:MAG: G5 domain-containing protein [Defluviitaleaceae bacterium]|nr:G5 domain-containing protein [Defluviitaleaceae bacterium]